MVTGVKCQVKLAINAESNDKTVHMKGKMQPTNERQRHHKQQENGSKGKKKAQIMADSATVGVNVLFRGKTHPRTSDRDTTNRVNRQARCAINVGLNVKTHRAKVRVKGKTQSQTSDQSTKKSTQNTI